MKPSTRVTISTRFRESLVRVLLIVALTTVASPAAAQPVPTAAEKSVLDAAVAAAAAEQGQLGPPATLTYANRHIVQLRATLFGRSPDERVNAARLTLDRLVESRVTGPVESRPLGLVMSVEAAGHRVVAIMPSDVDALAGETPANVAAAAGQRLQLALTEAVELRRPRQLIVAALAALLGTVIFAALVWVLWKVDRAARRWINESAERRLQTAKAGSAHLVRSSRIMGLLHRTVGALSWSFGLILAFAWFTFVLRRFPYTRPWGESLRAFLLDQFSGIGVAVLRALPGLFTVLLIVLITRFVARLVQLLFQSFEAGRVTIPWMYPETAQPTRKLLTVGLWLFAIVIAYPYLPGSDSDAFKGMSVFVGLVVSLGSSGIVNQVMSGLTLTYSRALRVGDFVAVGDVEGTVTLVGSLSTKIKTIKGEDVTIPNTVVVSQMVTNYSRYADTEGVLVSTDVTIGYDVPWRQVEALLLLAAARSAGVRREPAPRVRQTALEGVYIRYTLYLCPKDPAGRRETLAVVHANIVDAFNEYGVQITSPNYEADPAAPKVVPRDQWFAAPAAPAAAPDSRDVAEIKTERAADLRVRGGAVR